MRGTKNLVSRFMKVLLVMAITLSGFAQSAVSVHAESKSVRLTGLVNENTEGYINSKSVIVGETNAKASYNLTPAWAQGASYGTRVVLQLPSLNYVDGEYVKADSHGDVGIKGTVASGGGYRVIGDTTSEGGQIILEYEGGLYAGNNPAFEINLSTYSKDESLTIPEGTKLDLYGYVTYANFNQEPDTEWATPGAKDLESEISLIVSNLEWDAALESALDEGETNDTVPIWDRYQYVNYDYTIKNISDNTESLIEGFNTTFDIDSTASEINGIIPFDINRFSYIDGQAVKNDDPDNIRGQFIGVPGEGGVLIYDITDTLDEEDPTQGLSPLPYIYSGSGMIEINQRKQEIYPDEQRVYRVSLPLSRQGFPNVPTKFKVRTITNIFFADGVNWTKTHISEREILDPEFEMDYSHTHEQDSVVYGYETYFELNDLLNHSNVSVFTPTIQYTIGEKYNLNRAKVTIPEDYEGDFEDIFAKEFITYVVTDDKGDVTTKAISIPNILVDEETQERYFEIDLSDVVDTFTIHYKDIFKKYEQTRYSIKLYGKPTKVGPLTNTAKLVFIERQASNDELGDNTSYTDVPHEVMIDSTITVIYPNEVKPSTRIKVNDTWDSGHVLYGENVNLDFHFGVNNEQAESSEFIMEYNKPKALFGKTLTLKNQLFTDATGVEVYAIDAAGKETKLEFTIPTDGSDVTITIPEGTVSNKITTGPIKTDGSKHLATVSGKVEKELEKTHGVTATFKTYQADPYNKTSTAKANGRINIKLPDEIQPEVAIDVNGTRNRGQAKWQEGATLDFLYGTSGIASEYSVFEVIFNQPHAIKNPSITVSSDLFKIAKDVKFFTAFEDGTETEVNIPNTSRDFVYKLPENVIKVIIRTGHIKTESNMEHLVTIDGIIDNGSNMTHRVDASFEVYQNAPYDKATVAKAQGIINIELPDVLNPIHNIDVFYGTMKSNNVSYESIFDVYFRMDTKGVTSPQSTYTIDLLKPSGEGYFDVKEMIIKDDHVVQYTTYDLDGNEYINEMPEGIMTKVIIEYENFITEGLEDIVTMKIKADIDMGSNQVIKGVFSGNQNKPYDEIVVNEKRQTVTVFDTKTTVETKGVNQVDEKLGVGNKYSVDIFRHWGRGNTYNTRDYTLDQGYKSLGGFTTSLTRPTATYANNDQTTTITTQLPEHFDMYYLKIREQLKPYITDIKIYRNVDGEDEVWQTVTGDQWINNTQEGNFWRINTALMGNEGDDLFVSEDTTQDTYEHPYFKSSWHEDVRPEAPITKVEITLDFERLSNDDTPQIGGLHANVIEYMGRFHTTSKAKQQTINTTVDEYGVEKDQTRDHTHSINSLVGYSYARTSTGAHDNTSLPRKQLLMGTIGEYKASIQNLETYSVSYWGGHGPDIYTPVRTEHDEWLQMRNSGFFHDTLIYEFTYPTRPSQDDIYNYAPEYFVVENTAVNKYLDRFIIYGENGTNIEIEDINLEGSVKVNYVTLEEYPEDFVAGYEIRDGEIFVTLPEGETAIRFEAYFKHIQGFGERTAELDGTPQDQLGALSNVDVRVGGIVNGDKELLGTTKLYRLPDDSNTKTLLHTTNARLVGITPKLNARLGMTFDNVKVYDYGADGITPNTTTVDLTIENVGEADILDVDLTFTPDTNFRTQTLRITKEIFESDYWVDAVTVDGVDITNHFELRGDFYEVDLRDLFASKVLKSSTYKQNGNTFNKLDSRVIKVHYKPDAEKDIRMFGQFTKDALEDPTLPSIMTDGSIMQVIGIWADQSETGEWDWTSVPSFVSEGTNASREVITSYSTFNVSAEVKPFQPIFISSGSGNQGQRPTLTHRSASNSSAAPRLYNRVSRLTLSGEHLTNDLELSKDGNLFYDKDTDKHVSSTNLTVGDTTYVVYRVQNTGQKATSDITAGDNPIFKPYLEVNAPTGLKIVDAWTLDSLTDYIPEAGFVKSVEESAEMKDKQYAVTFDNTLEYGESVYAVVKFETVNDFGNNLGDTQNKTMVWQAYARPEKTHNFFSYNAYGANGHRTVGRTVQLVSGTYNANVYNSTYRFSNPNKLRIASRFDVENVSGKEMKLTVSNIENETLHSNTNLEVEVIFDKNKSSLTPVQGNKNGGFEMTKFPTPTTMEGYGEPIVYFEYDGKYILATDFDADKHEMASINKIKVDYGVVHDEFKAPNFIVEGKGHWKTLGSLTTKNYNIYSTAKLILTHDDNSEYSYLTETNSGNVWKAIAQTELNLQAYESKDEAQGAYVGSGVGKHSYKANDSFYYKISLLNINNFQGLNTNTPYGKADLLNPVVYDKIPEYLSYDDVEIKIYDIDGNPRVFVQPEITTKTITGLDVGGDQTFKNDRHNDGYGRISTQEPSNTSHNKAKEIEFTLVTYDFKEDDLKRGERLEITYKATARKDNLPYAKYENGNGVFAPFVGWYGNNLPVANTFKNYTMDMASLLHDVGVSGNKGHELAATEFLSNSSSWTHGGTERRKNATNTYTEQATYYDASANKEKTHRAWMNEDATNNLHTSFGSGLEEVYDYLTKARVNDSKVTSDERIMWAQNGMQLSRAWLYGASEMVPDVERKTHGVDASNFYEHDGSLNHANIHRWGYTPYIYDDYTYAVDLHEEFTVKLHAVNMGDRAIETGLKYTEILPVGISPYAEDGTLLGIKVSGDTPFTYEVIQSPDNDKGYRAPTQNQESGTYKESHRDEIPYVIEVKTQSQIAPWFKSSDTGKYQQVDIRVRVDHRIAPNADLGVHKDMSVFYDELQITPIGEEEYMEIYSHEYGAFTRGADTSAWAQNAKYYRNDGISEGLELNHAWLSSYNYTTYLSFEPYGMYIRGINAQNTRLDKNTLVTGDQIAAKKPTVRTWVNPEKLDKVDTRYGTIDNFDLNIYDELKLHATIENQQLEVRPEYNRSNEGYNRYSGDNYNADIWVNAPQTIGGARGGIFEPRVNMLLPEGFAPIDARGEVIRPYHETLAQDLDFEAGIYKITGLHTKELVKDVSEYLDTEVTLKDGRFNLEFIVNEEKAVDVPYEHILIITPKAKVIDEFDGDVEISLTSDRDIFTPLVSEQYTTGDTPSQTARDINWRVLGRNGVQISENDRKRPDSTSTWNSNMGVQKITERLIKKTILTDSVNGATEFKLREASLWNTTKALNYADGAEKDLEQVQPAGKHWYLTEVKNDVIKNANPYVESHSAGDVHHSRFVFTYLVSDFTEVTEEVRIKIGDEIFKPEEIGYTVDYVRTQDCKDGRQKVQFIVTPENGTLLSGDSFKFLFEVLMVDGYNEVGEGDVWAGDNLIVDSYVSLITDDKSVGTLDERDFVIQDESRMNYRTHITDAQLGENMNESDVSDYAHNNAQIEIVKPKLAIRKNTYRPRELYSNGLTGDNYFNAADTIEYIINHVEVTGSALKEVIVEDIIPTSDQTESSINVSRLPIMTDVFSVSTGVWEIPEETLARIEKAGLDVNDLFKVFVYASDDVAIDGYETDGWDLLTPEGIAIDNNQELELPLTTKKVRVVLRAMDHTNYLIPTGTKLAVDADPDTDGNQTVLETDPDNLNIELMPKGVVDNAIRIAMSAKSDATATLFIYNNAQAWANYVGNATVKLDQSETRSYLTPSRPVVNVRYEAKNFRNLGDEGYGWSDNTNINPHQLPHMKFKAEFVNADETMWNEEESNAYKSDLLRDPFISFELPKVMKSLAGRMQYVEDVTEDSPLHEDFINKYGLTDANEGLWTWYVKKADGTRTELELKDTYTGPFSGSANNVFSLWFEGDIAPGDSVVVEFIGSINYFAVPVKGDLQSKAKITNNTGLLTPLNSRWNLVNKLGYTVDDLDLNKDGSTSDRLVFAERDLFTYENVDNFKKTKRSYSDLNLAGTEYPEITPVRQGGLVTFETAIDNSQEAYDRTYPYPIFYDVLPHVGDTTIYNKNIPRNSKFNGLLVPDSINLAIEGSETRDFNTNEYTIYVGPFKKVGTRIDSVNLPDGAETEKFYDDLRTPSQNSPFRNEYFVTLADFNRYASGREAEIQNMLVMFNNAKYQMPARSKIKLTYDMKSPINASVKLDDSITPEDVAMWNSFSATQRVEGFSPQESNLAGAYTTEQPNTSYVKGFIWHDYNINGIKDEGILWTDDYGREILKPDTKDFGINGVDVVLKTPKGYHVDALGRPIHLVDDAWFVVDEDTGETVIDDIFLIPVTSDGPIVTQTENDYYGNAGHYVFSNIPQGQYVIEYEFDSQYATFGITTQDTIEIKDGGLKSKTEVLDLGDSQEIDIGIANQLKLGGNVFIDKNVNGTNDRAEIGYEGATVTLEDVNGNIVKDQHGNDIVTTADANGDYEFVITPMLPQYVISVLTHDENVIVSPIIHNIDPLKATNDNDAFTHKDDTKIQTNIINLDLDELYTSKFKDKMSISIGVYEFVNEYTWGNRVWNDINKDGIQDEDEPGIAGQRLTIEQYLEIDGEWVKQNFSKTTVSNADGFYYFSQLPDRVDGNTAAYKVTITEPVFGYNITLTTVGDDKNIDNNFRLDGTIEDMIILDVDNNSIDLGLHAHALGEISGELFLDGNANGIKDEDEVLSDDHIVVVERRLGSGKYETVETQITNSYHFKDLDMVKGMEAYDYRITVKEIPLWFDISDYQVGDDKTIDSDFLELIYDKFITVSTHDFKLNADADGLVDLDTYTNGIVTNIDLGLIKLDQTKVIGDYLWYDSNRNGLQDEEELPLVDMPIALYRVNGNRLTLIEESHTGENGHYEFEVDLANFDRSATDYNKPYEYVVLFDRLSRHELTHIDLDNADINSDFTSAKGYTNVPDRRHSVVSRVADISGVRGVYVDYQNTYDDLSIDGGIYLHDTILTIGDTVYEDLDLNGTQDPNEPGIKGMEIELYQNGILHGSTTSDNDGHYMFEVEALDLDKDSPTYLELYEYEVQIKAPANYRLTSDNFEYIDATDVKSLEITLIDEDGDLNTQRDDLTQDAGFAIYETESTLSGVIWSDDNEDGIQDESEEIYKGYTVELYRDGELHQTTKTNKDGRYTFTVAPTDYDKHSVDYLRAYDYKIKVIRDGNQVFAPYMQGEDITIDSNIESEVGHTGLSDSFNIFADGDVSSIRDDLNTGVGISTYSTTSVLSGIIWSDVDKDGFIEDEPRLENRVVTLWKMVDGNWKIEDNTTTNQDGEYSFTVKPTEYDLEHENYLVPYEYKVTSERNPNELWTVLENDNHFDSTGHSSSFEIFDANDVSSVKDDVKNGGLNIYPTSVRIGGAIWEDDNFDGLQDNLEEYYENYSVNLLSKVDDEWVIIDSTETDASGRYEFIVKPANYTNFNLNELQYRVAIDIEGNQTFAPYRAGDETLDSNIQAVTTPRYGETDVFDIVDSLDGIIDITTLRDDVQMDIGIKTYDMDVEIGGTVWNDDNFDGIMDSNEDRIENQEIVLWKFANEKWTQESITHSAADGTYRFTVTPTDYDSLDLPLYEYEVTTERMGNQEFSPYKQGDIESDSNILPHRALHTGHTDHFDIVDTIDGKVDISSLRDDLNMGIGIRTSDTKVKVGGIIWNDDNFDAVIDTDESGLEKEVTLWKLDGSTWIEVERTMSDSTGRYEFEVEPTNYELGHDDYLKPYQYKASVEREGYSIFSPYDTADSHVLQKRTTHTGYMDHFEIFEANNPASVKDDLNKNAGIKTYADKVLIGGIVWDDINLDAIMDPSEEVFINKEVVLHKMIDGEWEVIASQLTDRLGYYEFEVEPTSYDLTSEDYLKAYEYKVTVERAGFQEFTLFDTNDHRLTSENSHIGHSQQFDIFDSGDITSVRNDLTMHAGMTTYDNRVKVGGIVWEDFDTDGILSEEELRHEDYTVELWKFDLILDDWVYVKETVTDADGYYEFTVRPTDYDVDSELYLIPIDYQARITRSGNQVFSELKMGDDHTLDSDVFKEEDFTGHLVSFDIFDEGDITSLRDDIHRGVGLKSVDVTVTIGDTVWHDANYDGIKDDNEDRIRYVLVDLERYNPQTQVWDVIESIYTGKNGDYLFSVPVTNVDKTAEDYLVPYEYRTVVHIPEGYEATTNEHDSNHIDATTTRAITHTATLAELNDGLVDLLTIDNDHTLDVGLSYVPGIMKPMKPSRPKQLPETGVGPGIETFGLIFTVAGLVLLLFTKREEKEDED